MLNALGQSIRGVGDERCTPSTPRMRKSYPYPSFVTLAERKSEASPNKTLKLPQEPARKEMAGSCAKPIETGW